MRRWRTRAGVGVLLALLAVLAGCGATGAGDRRPGGTARAGPVHVLAAFYPLAFLAERVGGNRVEVEDLTRPGAEPHDLELTPRQVGAVGRADLAIFLGGFQPALDEAIRQNPPRRALDVSTVTPLVAHPDLAGGAVDLAGGATPARRADSPVGGGRDPHVWLDPVRYATMAAAVATALGSVDPAGAATYRANASRLQRDLTTLDRQFAAALSSCRLRLFVTSHEAFGYLAARYRLQQLGVSGLSPDSEPSPARVKQVQDIARRTGVRTIFFETLVSPQLAHTLARDLGISAAELDPLEGVAAGSGQDYLSVMRANLVALRKALSCS